MRNGEFEAAWKISDRILNAMQTDLPLHFKPVWNGESIDGKWVLVRCNRGLGDSIQCARWLPLVKARSRSLNIVCVPPLGEVFSASADVDRVFTSEEACDADADVEVEIMELPYLFRTTLDSLPRQVPYVFPKLNRRVRPSHTRMRVGLVWQAGDWDRRRSIPFDSLGPIFEVAGIDFIILQLEPRAAGWTPGRGAPVPCETLYKTAQVMRTLDLMISVDTMTAHLAGALGVPTWTLLHSDPDWRWLKTGDESPWYPTMRLFRQEIAGDWHPVMAAVALQLTAFGSPSRSKRRSRMTSVCP